MPNRDPKYRSGHKGRLKAPSGWLGETISRKNSADFDRQGVDLSGGYLGEDLHGLNLTEANLTGANLQKANLQRANLVDANLHGLNLTEANLTGADLRRTNLTEANLTGAILDLVKLHQANLEGADLSKATLTGANLHLANLTNANLQKANLEEANLRRANLHLANLTNANLQKANLDGANLDGADLKGSINGSFRNALNVPGYDIPCIAYQRQGLGHSRNESCKWCTDGIMTSEQVKAYNEAFEEWKKANPTVEATIKPITLTNSDPEYGEVGRKVDSVAATCSKCEHNTESFGYEQKSILRCLTVLREECPRNETNFYVSDEELTELWEREIGA